MICIYCSNPKTAVINSRSQIKTPQTWRRRKCLNCNKTFTTYERIAASDTLKCIKPKGQTVDYSFGQILLDIAACFDHAPEKRANKAYWLAQTVENKLLTRNETAITTQTIAKTVHDVMSSFDRFAAIQFAARHHNSL
jgi:transcriptional repressor NrdR